MAKIKAPKKIITVDQKQLAELKEQIAACDLGPEQKLIILALLDNHVLVQHLLQKKDLTIAKLLAIFGMKTEKNKKLEIYGPPLPPHPKAKGPKKPTPDSAPNVDKYPDAKICLHKHESLAAGDLCPECEKGKLYNVESGLVVSFEGAAPVSAIKNEYERLRCALCGITFTPQVIEELKQNRFAPKAQALLALYKYGGGFPFYRMAKFQKMFKFPISTSTQWEQVEQLAMWAFPITKYWGSLAANSDLAYIDDTGAKILNKAITPEQKRTGVFTTCGVFHDFKTKNKVTLYFTGHRHAGENLGALLGQRDGHLAPILQMSDALSRNCPKGILTNLINCNTHARRNFFIIKESFPRECGTFIKWMAQIYYRDSLTGSMSAEQRMLLHQKKSSKIFKRMIKWCHLMLYKKKVEPNSHLGAAMQYFINHHKKLGKFLTVPGAPLDNK